MEKINDILQDESINDKQLVKELSLYVKNHKDKNKKINKEFVNDVLNIVFRNSEVDFNKIYFLDFGVIASWNPEWYENTKFFDFNITDMLNESKTFKKKIKSKEGDSNIFSYYYILSVIIHEVTHARQDYIKENNYNEIYASCDEFVDKYYSEYEEYHDEILIERYANIRGHMLAYEVLSYVYPKEKISKLKIFVFMYLFIGYYINHDDETIKALWETKKYDNFEITTAIDTFNNIMLEKSLPIANISNTEDMTLYERFYLGLPISNDEYLKLRKLYFDICREKEDKNANVKTLINRL